MVDPTPQSTGPIPGQVRHGRAKAEAARQPSWSDTINRFLAAGARMERSVKREQDRIAFEDSIRGDATGFRPLAILGPGGEFTREVRP